MIATSPLTPLPVAVPMVGAAPLACLRKGFNRAAVDSLGIALAGATLATSGPLLAAAVHGASVYWFGNWYPRGSIVLSIGFVAEPIGVGLAVLASTLTQHDLFGTI